MGLVVTQRQTASFQLAFFPIPKRQGYLCDYSFVPFFDYLPWNDILSKKYFQLKRRRKSIQRLVLLVGCYTRRRAIERRWAPVCVCGPIGNHQRFGVRERETINYIRHRERRAKSPTTPKKKKKMTSAVHSRGNISTSASQISSSSPSAFCFSDIFCSYLIFSFFLVAV
jgi:hypothetical protein